jgi:cell division protein FtsW
MLLFLALVARGFMLSARTGDTFCSLVIAGISLKIALQVLLNIAVVSSVIPNTGISLPFFSSGGSATMMQLIDVGLVLGCSKYADAQ